MGICDNALVSKLGVLTSVIRNSHGFVVWGEYGRRFEFERIRGVHLETCVYVGARYKYSSYAIVMLGITSSVLWYISDAIVNAGMSIDINRGDREGRGWLSVSKVNYYCKMQELASISAM